MDTDVAIVGCGPVGAVAANLLGLQGVRVLILERERIGHGQPRAFSCDDEALRVYQAAGLVDEVRAHMAHASAVHYTGVGGRKFAELDIAGLDFGNGFPPLNFFYQPTLEAELRRGLRRFDRVELHLGREVTAISQDAGGVTLDVREAGGDERWTVRAKFVLGCDGARSTVRRLAGIGLTGDSYPDRWLAVSGQPEDEGALRIREVTFVCDPDRPTFVAEGAENDFWMEMMVNPPWSPEKRRRYRGTEKARGTEDPIVLCSSGFCLFLCTLPQFQAFRNGRKTGGFAISPRDRPT